MTAAGLPYRLRPNKFIDRELFAELVSLIVAERGSDTYAYISMGGKHLSDHLAIYRRAGLKKLYSFDQDSEIVLRQKFNAPFQGVVCDVHSSDELPARLDSIVEDMDVENVIIWLDYTEPKHLVQLAEIETLCTRLVIGDVLRVTLNVDFKGLHKRDEELSDQERRLPLDEKQVALMKRQLGSYLPQKIVRIGDGDMSGAVAESVLRACEIGFEDLTSPRKPLPLLITEYRDTTSMLTVTILVRDENDNPAVPEGWSWLPKDCSSVERILAPDLSPRERYTLDKEMHRSANQISTALGFKMDSDVLRSFERFHRFYPTFQTVGD